MFYIPHNIVWSGGYEGVGGRGWDGIVNYSIGIDIYGLHRKGWGGGDKET